MATAGSQERAQGDRGGLRKVAMARTERYSIRTVRYLPLGSPWTSPKRSYVHVQGCPSTGVPFVLAR